VTVNAVGLALGRGLALREELLHRPCAVLEAPLERAHASLPRVVAHDVADRRFGDRELAFLQPGRL